MATKKDPTNGNNQKENQNKIDGMNKMFKLMNK
jgi:hypothetical protein